MQEVWNKLPSDPDLAANGMIVSLTLLAYEHVIALEPPIPTDRRALEKHARQYWADRDPTYEGIAISARLLRQDLDRALTVTRQEWNAYCNGTSFDEMLSLLTKLVEFFEARAAERKEFLKSLHIPAPPRKRRGENVQRRWFSAILSDWFLRLYGRPRDDIVALLETTVFRLPDTKVVIGETIRGRRRTKGHRKIQD
jgi:hypothetical protein